MPFVGRERTIIWNKLELGDLIRSTLLALIVSEISWLNRLCWWSWIYTFWDLKLFHLPVTLYSPSINSFPNYQTFVWQKVSFYIQKLVHFSLCIAELQTKPEVHRLNGNNNFKIVHLGDEVPPPAKDLTCLFKSDSCTKHLPHRSRCAEMCLHRLLRTIHSLFLHYFTMSAEGGLFSPASPHEARAIEWHLLFRDFNWSDTGDAPTPASA